MNESLGNYLWHRLDESAPRHGRHCQVVWAATVRKRQIARPKKSPPMSATVRNCGQTTLMPAPRYRMDCANETKCVDGDACMMVASQYGMLSSGVLAPESMF